MALIRKRLAQGASPSLSECERGMTPLMAAASTGNPESIDLFLPFSDIAAINADGHCALSLLLMELSGFYRIGNNIANAPQRWLESLRKLCFKPSSRGNCLSPLAHAARYWSRADLDINTIIAELAPFTDFSETFGLDDTPCSAALRAACPGRGTTALAIYRADPLNATSKAMRPELCELICQAAAADQVAFLRAVGPTAPMDIRHAFGRTPFLAAAANRSVEAMEVLLAMGCDAGAVDDDGCDALMLAIEDCESPEKHERCCELVLSLIPPSNLWLRDHLGESALDKALDRSMPRLAQIIEAKTPQPSPAPSPRQHPSPAPSSTPSAKLQRLFVQAIDANNMLLFKKRLRQGASASIPAPENARTPLFFAIKSRRLEMIQALIPLAHLCSPCDNGEGALACYLQSGPIHSDATLSILGSLLSPESVRACELSGSSPLALLRATPSTFPLALALLAPLCDREVLHAEPDFDAFCAYDHLALWLSHPNQPRIATQSNARGETLAHAASRNPKLLSAISSHADFSARDINGLTPLMAACSHRHVDEYLVAAIAILASWSDCRAVDHNGCDALMLAMESASSDNLGEIIAQLAPRVDLFARDFMGESALDKALDRGLANAAKSIGNHLNIHQERADLAASAPLPNIEIPTRSSARL